MAKKKHNWEKNGLRKDSKNELTKWQYMDDTCYNFSKGQTHMYSIHVASFTLFLKKVDYDNHLRPIVALQTCMKIKENKNFMSNTHPGSNNFFGIHWFR